MKKSRESTKSDLGTATHSALKRMTDIHLALQSQQLGRTLPLKAKDLAKKHDVVNRTIQRDIKFMKEIWGLPIEYDRGMGGYYYDEIVTDFPGVKLTEEEIFAFLVARNSIERYEGTNLSEPLSKLFEKLVDQLQISHSDHIKRVKEYISFKPAGWAKGKYSILDKLSKSCRDEQFVSFEYDKPWTGKVLKKRVKPIHLVNHDGAWYLIVSENKKDPAPYSIARISSLRTHPTKFESVPFCIEKFMKHHFGIFHGDTLHTVKVHFDEYAAPYIRERKWNSSQKIRNLKDGKIEFEIVVIDLIEIKGWIMNWGKHAKVLSPPILVDDLTNDLNETLELYNQSQP